MDTGVILIFNTERVNQSLHHLVRQDMDVKEHERLKITYTCMDINSSKGTIRPLRLSITNNDNEKCVSL